MQISQAQCRPVLVLMHSWIAAASRGSGLSSSALAGHTAKRQRTTDASRSASRRIPHRRVRRVDDAHIGRVELLELRHLGIRKFEVEHVDVLPSDGPGSRCAGSRRRPSAPDSGAIPARHSCRAPCRCARARRRPAPCRARSAIGDHRHAVLLACRQHLVLVDEGMHLDLVADQRLGRHRPGLVQHGRGEIGDADMLGLAVLLGLAERADADA